MASSYRRTIVLGLDYSEFTGGIDECNSKMKQMDEEFKHSQAEMGNSASASDKYANKAEYLSEKMEVQKRKVELARQKYEELKNSQADTSAIERARSALTREETTLANLNNQYNETIMAQSNFKASAQALIQIVRNVANAMKDCAVGAAEYADEIMTLSSQTGVSERTLQEWAYAADLIDVELSTITTSFAKLEKAMAENEGAFASLGISVTQANGHMKSAEQVFYEVIDALGQIENKTERDQAAMQIFGKSAQELDGVIRAGSEGLREYAEEADRLGRIMTTEDIQASSAFSDALARLEKTTESVKNKIGAALAPVLEAIANLLNAIPTDVLAIITVVGTLASVIAAVIVFIKAAQVAYVALLPAMKAVTVEMMAQGGYVTLVVTAITTLITLLQKARIEYQNLQKVMKDNGWNNSLKDVLRLTFKKEVTSSETGEVIHLANGGVTKGGQTWVGENGPELVSLPAGSRVYNHTESKQIAGGTTYNITMNCDLNKMRSVADVVDAINGLSSSAAARG